jgi:hypothetical protein
MTREVWNFIEKKLKQQEQEIEREAIEGFVDYITTDFLGDEPMDSDEVAQYSYKGLLYLMEIYLQEKETK